MSSAWSIFMSVLSSVACLLLALVVYRKVLNPEKSFWNCFLSICLTPLRVAKLGPYREGVSLEHAMKYAMTKTKLFDFGGTKFVGNYAVVMSGKEQSKLRFHNIGYIMAQLELNITMVRRLRMVQYLKDSPNVLKIGVRQPVFVVGLPRTGTTFLHRLLSLDPAVRAPLLWELLSPVPNVVGARKEDFIADSQQRAEAVRAQLKMRQDAGDRALEHIHEVVYDAPEECLMAMSDEIPCLTQNFYAVYMDTKTFFSCVNPAAVVDSYLHYKRVLQLLAYQHGDFKSRFRWMLKSPIHLFYIKELAEAFPDATIIWTHRHPVNAVPSLCSLLKAVHKVYYEPTTHDDAALGKAVRDLSADLLEQVPRDIRKTGLASCNVVYDNFVRDPIATVKSLYAQLGWTFSAEYEMILREHLLKDKKKRDAMKAKRGSSEVLHNYGPGEFGLTADDLTLSPQFANYIRNFNIQ